MKASFASLIAVLFLLAGFTAHAADSAAPSFVVYGSDDATTDDAKTPTTDTETKDEEEKKKPEEDKKPE